jgi:hypothetical protein
MTRAEQRPSRSGTPTTPNAARARKMVTVTLSPEHIAKADALAARWDETRSGAIGRAIDEAAETTRTRHP